MKITIVMGLAGSGKSTYIKNNFADRKVIDLYDFQRGLPSTYEAIYKSYEDCRDALIKEIKEGNDVVLEHTLLRAIRREMYVNAIKEVTNEPIEIILINPPFDILVERLKEREIFYSEEMTKEHLAVLEIPIEEEGFSKVIIINE